MLGNVGAAHSEGVVERLSVPESIEFDGESYRLSWSSHPRPHYYKQEYLPSGQTSESFQRMILIEVTAREVNVKDVVAAQINMLNKRKLTDPTVNFAILQNSKNNEIILDFILSAQDSKGEDIVEWNAYRYTALKGKGGVSGVLLFGISRRGYGDDVTNFLRRLKSVRPAEINALAAYPLGRHGRPSDRLGRLSSRYLRPRPRLDSRNVATFQIEHEGEAADFAPSSRSQNRVRGNSTGAG
jgi:hypothetical protein